MKLRSDEPHPRGDVRPGLFAGSSIWCESRQYRANLLLEVKSMNPSASLPGRIVLGVFFVTVLALLAMFPARADVRILSSSGGAVGRD
jgi:hypothetical protein